MTIPDWDFWLDFDQVTAWQAVSLSVNIDPDSVQFNRERYSISPVMDAEIASLFSKRSRILEPRIINDFKTRGLIIGAGTLGIQISLRDFAGWAKNRSWEIPQSLSDAAELTLPLTQAIASQFVESPNIESESTSDEMLNYENSLPIDIKPILNPPQQREKNKWDEHNLRRLLSEYREPEMTFQKLADKYLLSRQFIARKVKDAENLFGTKKIPSPFEALKNLKLK